MNKKAAIVTGASSGFGLLTALGLAQAGFQVLATVRNEEKEKNLLLEAQKRGVLGSIAIQHCDVTCSQSIFQLKNKMKEMSNIEVLVNNAGFALGGFSEELSIDDYRRQFETNVFGVISITQLALPYMKAQKKGRIINMGSISGKVGFPGLSAYTASKHALEGYSESLRLELLPFGIDVSILEPGSYKTNIWSAIDQTRNSENSSYHIYNEAILHFINKRKSSHGDPQEIADLIVMIATSAKRPKFRYPIGKGIKQTIGLKSILPWSFLEKIILKKLRMTDHDK
ncbi:SDR family oxidoreductase [Bacillus massilinigeriensis]|uniref:SDR family oxidoreductase n=1 Tax=Bacillus mediterraneensis TaxID=1805474 RepID=UPI0008F8BDE4|nr:SDR family oxidoreductase [Bacillus mediterraneensis]